MLVNLFVCFRISPSTDSSLRFFKKEKKSTCGTGPYAKMNLLDTENMLASDLLKFCHLWEDAKAEEMGLQFTRNAQVRKLNLLW